MSNVIILGGHGKVALLASPKITQKGHVLTSVVRNPDHVSEVEATGAQAVVEDMQELDVDGFRRLFDGQDVVIWALVQVVATRSAPTPSTAMPPCAPSMPPASAASS